MIDRKDDWVQFGTLIPRGLHRQAKLYCVRRDVTLADFVSVALREKLETSPRVGVWTDDFHNLLRVFDW